MSVLKDEWGTDQGAFFPFRGNALSTPFASEEERDNWLIQKRSETGSGSKSNVSMLGVVAMDKQYKTVKMHPLTL